jgi:hypothetical protein
MSSNSAVHPVSQGISPITVNLSSIPEKLRASRGIQALPQGADEELPRGHSRHGGRRSVSGCLANVWAVRDRGTAATKRTIQSASWTAVSRNAPEGPRLIDGIHDKVLRARSAEDFGRSANAEDSFASAGSVSLASLCDITVHSE